jgi:hypothetical protein
MKKEFTLQKTYDVNVTIEIIKENDSYIALVNRNFDDLWKEQDRYDCWIEDGDGLMTEPTHTEDEFDAIVETFREYIIANSTDKFARVCDKCGNGMNDGYVVYGGDEYYCSPKCLHEVYSPKEWQEMYDDSEENGGNDNYWTQWEDEDVYYLFDNQLIEI